MSQPKVVSIGGIAYDSRTGQPAVKRISITTDATPKPVNPRTSVRNDVKPVHAKGVHAPQQRSKTLTRRFVAKKTTQAAPITQTRKNLDFKPKASRSAHISKFAPDPQALTVKRHIKKPATSSVAARPHPSVKKALDIQSTKRTPATAKAPTAQEIKHAELGKALANAKPQTKAPKKSRSRTLSVATASLGLLLMAGYFTYVNMPNLSVRVAAAQAGINASFPEYRPVGYTLNGPVSYQDGEVNMKFASNSGPLAFALSQSTTAWDSAALLEKYVNPRSESKYATYNDGGLTIYTYGTNAAWVNGGILYTIEGTANLSNEQIRRIATSM